VSTMATILVIDDEDSIRNLLKEVLEKAHHRVLEARDGREGLTLYQNNKVDLVLMDILMPGTDGLEATLQLTREYLDAKVIAMTGAQGDRNFLDVAKLFGARRVFEKPFDLSKMVEAVTEELAR
jgi:two-component system, response regulator, stage 0 sporulation protein F